MYTFQNIPFFFSLLTHTLKYISQTSSQMVYSKLTVLVLWCWLCGVVVLTVVMLLWCRLWCCVVVYVVLTVLMLCCCGIDCSGVDCCGVVVVVLTVVVLWWWLWWWLLTSVMAMMWGLISEILALNSNK